MELRVGNLDIGYRNIGSQYIQHSIDIVEPDMEPRVWNLDISIEISKLNEFNTQ
jgi:hypothetical protein